MRWKRNKVKCTYTNYGTYGRAQHGYFSRDSYANVTQEEEERSNLVLYSLSRSSCIHWIEEEEKEDLKRQKSAASIRTRVLLLPLSFLQMPPPIELFKFAHWSVRFVRSSVHADDVYLSP